MRALATPSYGPLSQLTVVDLPLPTPGRGEVRVRVHATALNPADYRVATGSFRFLHARNFPMVLGYDFSGVIDEVGPGAGPLQRGDEVFGFLPYSPWNRRGACAEAVIASANEVTRKPSSLTHQEAAALATPGLTALQALRDHGKVKAGQRVAITGVSGGVGSLAVNVAVRLGAIVTAIGTRVGLELAARNGATTVIDRTKVDATAREGAFDVVLDAAATSRLKAWRGALSPTGTFITTLPSAAFAVDTLRSLFGRQRCAFIAVKSKADDLAQLAAWAEDGLRSALDASIGLADVPHHLQRLQRGEVKGRVVVSPAA